MTDTLLISTQSYRHEYIDGAETEIPTQYGYLVKMTVGQSSLETLAIPTSTETPHDERIKTGLRGLCRYEDKIYVASWNTVYIIDLESLSIIDQFSHPLMADLHGLYVDRDGIWVTSSLIDTLLVFDHSHQFLGKLHFSPTDLYPADKRKTIDTTQDYRLRGKEFSGFQHFHNNHIEGYDEHYMIATGRCRGQENGKLLLVNRDTLQWSILYHGLNGPHDGIINSHGQYITTETNSGSVAILDMPKTIDQWRWMPYKWRSRFGKTPKLHKRIFLETNTQASIDRITSTRFWTRGLGINQKNDLFVGKSVWAKEANRYASIVHIDSNTYTQTEYPLLIADYPETRIFQVLCL